MPDGGTDSIWAKAAGSSDPLTLTWDTGKLGFRITTFAQSGTEWYPFAAYRAEGTGSIAGQGTKGSYFTANYSQRAGSAKYACALALFNDDTMNVMLNASFKRARGCSVRCVKE